ncbi:MAG: hypothetical protein AVDCRST_MAG79-706, partial [uncultured Thermoleophilia bacterium]
ACACDRLRTCRLGRRPAPGRRGVVRGGRRRGRGGVRPAGRGLPRPDVPGPRARSGRHAGGGRGGRRRVRRGHERRQHEPARGADRGSEVRRPLRRRPGPRSGARGVLHLARPERGVPDGRRHRLARGRGARALRGRERL